MTLFKIINTWDIPRYSTASNPTNGLIDIHTYFTFSCCIRSCDLYLQLDKFRSRFLGTIYTNPVKKAYTKSSCYPKFLTVLDLQ